MSGLDARLMRARLAAQALAGPPVDTAGCAGAVAVTQRLLAIQGQDLRGARLAVRARSTRVTAADVDRALGEDRAVVLTWLNRGTLHLVAAEDYPLLQALTTAPQRTANDRRLAQEGLTPDAAARAVRCVERALADSGPLDSGALREVLERAGLLGAHTGRQALTHVLFAAALQGRIVRGPIDAPTGRHRYARLTDWLPELPPATARVAADRDRALAELARRYLAGHGPASDRDLAKWSGLPLRDARSGLTTIASQLLQRPDGLVELLNAAGSVPPPLPPPRLLGAFEPLLMGWVSRDEILGRHADEVITGGVFRAFVLVRGHALGLWRIRGAEPAIETFAPLRPADERALARDAQAVVDFLEP